MQPSRFRKATFIKGVIIATTLLIVQTLRGIERGRDAGSIVMWGLLTWILLVGFSAVVALIVPILDPRDPRKPALNELAVPVRCVSKRKE